MYAKYQSGAVYMEASYTANQAELRRKNCLAFTEFFKVTFGTFAFHLRQLDLSLLFFFEFSRGEEFRKKWVSPQHGGS